MHVFRLSTAEQELQILRAQAVHGDLIVVDGTSNHSSLLLLQRHHSRLDAVFNAQTGDHAGPPLTDAMATVCGLPLSSWIPPSKKCQQISMQW
jgi:hypothetical protein